MADNFGKNYVVARSYAKAIFNIALTKDKLQEWSDILNTLAFIANDVRVLAFLAKPQLNWQERAALFIDVCEQILSKDGKAAIQLLAMNKRLSMLPEIANLYEEFRIKDQGAVKVKVISTSLLTKEQQEKLRCTLGGILLLEYEQDSSLIGGIILCIGDQIIDGSIRGRLEQLRKCLID